MVNLARFTMNIQNQGDQRINHPMIRKRCEEDDDDGLHMLGLHPCRGSLNAHAHANNAT